MFLLKFWSLDLWGIPKDFRLTCRLRIRDPIVIPRCRGGKPGIRLDHGEDSIRSRFCLGVFTPMKQIQKNIPPPTAAHQLSSASLYVIWRKLTCHDRDEILYQLKPLDKHLASHEIIESKHTSSLLFMWSAILDSYVNDLDWFVIHK